MVDIYIGSEKGNKRRADVEDNIEMIRQVMDIFDISVRVVDYSKTFTMPKTAVNKDIFDGLGFADSLFPYKRSYADVYVLGILIMQDAFVQVKEGTPEHYSVSLVSESKEIWKVIENDTLGELDFEDTNHTKTAQLIKDQWESGITPATKYFYFLADYGGKLPSGNQVYADYIVPSYRISYLVDLINDKYNVNIILPAHLADTFITFSDAKEIEQTNDKVVYNLDATQTPKKFSEIFFPIEEDGDYQLEINGGHLFAPFHFIISVGGFQFNSYPNSYVTNYVSPIIYAKKGDVLRSPIEQFHFSGTIKLTRKAIDVSGNKSFQNYKINDFLKEIIYQSASIPIKTGASYHFTTLTEIIENTAEDWSGYFDSVKKTTYIVGKYGQNNWMRYKYAEREDFNKDGVIHVGNVNLDTNKDIIKSTLYNTPVNSVPFSLGGTTLLSQQYHLWNRTVEQKNGVFEERYQPQAGRMFLLEANPQQTSSNFEIKIGGNTVSTNKAVLANNENYNFQTVINKRYREYSKILQTAEIEDAVFRIPIVAFSNFDFKRRVYVAQLGGHYIVNRLKYKTEELMDVELIKADISPDADTNEVPGPTYPMNIVFASNNAQSKTLNFHVQGTKTEQIVLLNAMPPVIELLVDDISFPFTTSGNLIEFQYNYDLQIASGPHEIKLSDGTNFSNVLNYTIL